jgi:hypothetical protein
VSTLFLTAVLATILCGAATISIARAIVSVGGST